MLLNKVIRGRDKAHHHHHHQPASKGVEVAVAQQSPYANVPALVLGSGEQEDPDIEIDRLALINSSRSSSALAKGFSDTDSGISNTGSSSCESFQSDHYLPDPGKDVLYDDTIIPGTDGVIDFDDDDFTFKLNLSLANLGIGPYGEYGTIMPENVSSSCGGGSGIASINRHSRFADYAHFDFNLDALGVDFDIVEPPPAFANSNGEDDKCQLVVDSEAEDPNECISSAESHNLAETSIIECSSATPVEEEDDDAEEAEDEELALLTENGNNGALYDNVDVPLQTNGKFGCSLERSCRKGGTLSRERERRKETKASGDSSSSGSDNCKICSVTTNGNCSKEKGGSCAVSTAPGQQQGKRHHHKLRSDGSDATAASSTSGKKRKRERYEIRIGYVCYELPISSDKHVSIYSLQKNKDMMEDLLGHSKLKNSKWTFFLSLSII